jgi:hypothetical protein
MWSCSIVEALAAGKAEGLTFDQAWAEALEMYPPRGRDLGPTVPSLLDEDESPAVFLERVCRDAWSGARPVLRHLANAMELIEVLDQPGVETARTRAGASRAHMVAGDA